MNELERLEKQRNELNRKIQQLKRREQTINGNAYLERTSSGKLYVRVKRKDFYCPERKTSSCAILGGYKREEIADALGDVIEDLRMIHRSLTETSEETTA